jgi:hypothetical protein
VNLTGLEQVARPGAGVHARIMPSPDSPSRRFSAPTRVHCRPLLNEDLDRRMSDALDFYVYHRPHMGLQGPKPGRGPLQAEAGSSEGGASAAWKTNRSDGRGTVRDRACGPGAAFAHSRAEVSGEQPRGLQGRAWLEGTGVPEPSRAPPHFSPLSETNLSTMNRSRYFSPCAIPIGGAQP